MSLLDTFKGPKWQHKDPDVRLKAIETIDDPKLLMELASNDPDTGVQSKALAQIKEPADLDTLIESLSGDMQQQAKNQRLAAILPPPDAFAALAQDHISRDDLQRIIQLTDNPELLRAAVARFDDENTWLELACTHPLAQVRLICAEHIKSPSLIEELMQRARGHDKGVYRHCKTMVDEHQAKELEKARREAFIEELSQKAANLAAAEAALDYEARYLVLKRQWATVETDADSRHREAFQHALETCEKRLAALKEAETATAQLRAQKEAAGADCSAVLAELDQLAESYGELDDSSTLAHLSSTLEGLKLRWQSAVEFHPAGKQQEQAFREKTSQWQQLADSAQNLLDQQPDIEKLRDTAGKVDVLDFQALEKMIARCNKLMKAFSWPQNAAVSKPSALGELEQVQEQLNENLGTLKKNQQKYSDRINALLITEREHLEQERTREAGRAHGKIRRLLKSLSPASRKAFEKQMGPMASQLHEAHDWQEFAVEPKKVALCASMKELIGSEEDIEILALKIQTLQNEWKQLGGLPHAREQELWREFKAAADEAWKPCKAAFSEQAEQQRKNLQSRMALVRQLTEYEQKMAWPDTANGTTESGASPDWPLVQKTLDTARKAFSNIKPVSPKGERDSKKAFRTICDQIYGHIKAEYERNIERKKELVKKAENLAEEEDLGTAIDTAKKLQREWKETGMTPVKVDRKLWKSFRAACDGVFARLDEQRAQNAAALKEQVGQAEALFDQARALLDEAAGESVLQAGKALAELNRQVRELHLPSAVRQRMFKDFGALETKAKEMAKAIRISQELAIWDELLASVKACATASESERTTTDWPLDNRAFPKGIDAAALQEFWKEGPDAQAAEAHRDACINLEILGELETPEADKKARMNLQMQRLVQGLGAKVDNQEQAELDCINEFIGLRPTLDWVERFWETLRIIRAAGTA